MTELPFQQKILRKLLDKPQNHKCADCNSKSPTWASLDYGVFVCLNCSGAHRRLGPRNTRIKSTTLDIWYTQWAQLMVLDNQFINGYWEQNLNGRKKPTNTSSQQQINKYIEQKYLKKKYADPNRIPPIVQLKQRRNKGELISSTQQFRRNNNFIQQNYENPIQQDLWNQQQDQLKPVSTAKNASIHTPQSDIMSFDQDTKKTHSIDFNPHQQHHNIYNSQSLFSKPINQNNYLTFQQPNYYIHNQLNNIHQIPQSNNIHQTTQYQYNHNYQSQFHQPQNQYNFQYNHHPIQHQNRFFQNSSQQYTYNNNNNQVNNNQQQNATKQLYQYQSPNLNLNFYDIGVKSDTKINATQKQTGNKLYKQFDQFR